MTGACHEIELFFNWPQYGSNNKILQLDMQCTIIRKRNAK